MTVPPSREVTSEAFWRSGGGFVWIRPKLTVYRPADTRPRVGLNRYPHNVIGVGVVAFRRCFSLQWKGSPRGR